VHQKEILVWKLIFKTNKIDIKKRETREKLYIRVQKFKGLYRWWPGLAAIDTAIIGQNRLPTNNWEKIIGYF